MAYLALNHNTILLLNKQNRGCAHETSIADGAREKPGMLLQ